MKLNYRGQIYETTSPSVEMTESLQVGLFLGNRYKLKQHNICVPRQVPTQLTYRGISYIR